MENDDPYESGYSSEDNLSVEKPKYVSSSYGCCYNFSNKIFKLSVISYYFWTAFCYIIGSIIFVTGYNSSSLRIEKQIACAASSNVYLFSMLWFLIGIISVITCIGYAAAIDEENNNIYSDSSPLFIYILGILCKTIPTIVRIIHIFNLFQLYVITLDIMILPECNSFPVRFILFIIHILWWVIVFFGIISRKKFFLPPHIYKPITNDDGYIVYVNNLLHSFGL
ncbi:hypothetical protein MKS88_002069 [Plasmodium brasilianum]|uniref:Transmembrane protein n=2 Tax=Plasmodium (Plasmodium) TaxID=418103 RepID=A0A1A8WN97_PLAMA|nr:conserved Plasmodium protein, unknown function [Plasmodium malariae]KAI4839515.1 hypothetical protein MKS88_002069 [Plasmodium brasilianum]SBS92775.1 conserved Plasmodium protein, unknown function [Plasmodium malariae]SBT87937.1 conserved Plasmodium protein, unknown function [Plasmodium malariae]